MMFGTVVVSLLDNDGVLGSIRASVANFAPFYKDEVPDYMWLFPFGNVCGGSFILEGQKRIWDESK
jgi:hypothetical protein